MPANDPSSAVPPHVMRYLRGPTEADRQFDFLVGEWHVHATRLSPEGVPQVQYEARWSAAHLNDGRMLMDDFKALAPDGRVMSSFVTLRTYSAEARRWEMTGMAAMQAAARLVWHGSWAHGEMQIFAAGLDPAGQEVQTKIRFFDITPDRFLWASESSMDGGRSWTPTASLVADRVKAVCSG